MLNEETLISIVIPIYNGEKYITRCLDSILNQSFKNWQAICIDDGSSDKTLDIIRGYAKKDKRFVVVHKENGGVAVARNLGIDKVNTKYMMFVDSDDCIHPQTLEIAYDFIVKKNADIVSWAYDKDLYDVISSGKKDADQEIQKRSKKVYNLDKIKSKQTTRLIKFATERNHSYGGWKIRHCYPVVHLYRSEFIKNIKFNADIKIAEDFPFWIAVLLRNPKAVILKVPLYFYIPNSFSALGAATNKKVFENLTLATLDSFLMVKKYGPDKSWVRIWNREFLWPFIISFMRAFRKCDKKDCFAYAKEQLVKMKKLGVFDNPPTMRARKYKRRIEKFIS